MILLKTLASCQKNSCSFHKTLTFSQISYIYNFTNIIIRFHKKSFFSDIRYLLSIITNIIIRTNCIFHFLKFFFKYIFNIIMVFIMITLLWWRFKHFNWPQDRNCWIFFMPWFLLQVWLSVCQLSRIVRIFDVRPRLQINRVFIFLL